MVPISIMGQERGASCPVSEQVNDQAGGSGQGPAAAHFGNDSATRSKGRFSVVPPVPEEASDFLKPLQGVDVPDLTGDSNPGQLASKAAASF